MNWLSRVKPSIWLFGLGYMGFYIPYSALTKSLSEGILPGIQQPVSGFQMLPAMAIGAMLTMPILMFATGLWRYAERRQLANGFRIFLPGKWPILSGMASAFIIGATTMNYTFAGLSIVFVLLLMRGGVLILSPLIDWIRLRPVSAYSWTALALSLIAVSVAVADVTSYQLNRLVLLSLAIYLVGYVCRFLLMSKHAKSGHKDKDRTFFVEEHIATTPLLFTLLALMALLMPGQTGSELRYGFTDFLTQPAVVPAFFIGVLYESLFIFGSLIYLSPREFTYCVPINRASSLIAGVIAATLLEMIAGMPAVRISTLIAVGIMLLAMVVLAAGPQLKAWLVLKFRARALKPLMIVFVCSKNTARSPMAEALCAAEIASKMGLDINHLHDNGVVITSAGLHHDEGAPMSKQAAATLKQIGINSPTHFSRQLTAEIISRADAVFCMTREQRDIAAEISPECKDHIYCLNPEKDISNPKGHKADQYLKCVQQIKKSISKRLPELGYV